MRPWIASATIAVVAGLMSGCTHPKKDLVSVDLSRVPTIAWESGTPSAPVVKVSSPPSAVLIPGRPAVELVTQVKDVRAVEKLLADQQEETRRKLEKGLAQLYARLARRFELKELAALSDRERKRYDDVNANIRLVFEQYAADRLPRVARLAFLAGFPDPNPTSLPPEAPLGKVSQNKFDEAKALRGEISLLDENFEATVKALLDEIDNQNSMDRTDSRLKIELNADDLRRRAETEASEQVNRARQSLHLDLAGGQTIRMPAIPARTITPPRMPAPEPAPKVDSALDANAAAWQKKMLEGQLRIWAAVNRYQIQPGGRDATDEFIKWNAENQAGR
jgi:hypothetical protein